MWDFFCTKKLKIKQNPLVSPHAKKPSESKENAENLAIFLFFACNQPLRYVFRFFLSSVAGFFFSPCASVLSRDSDFKIGVSCFCAQKFFSTADQGHWEHRELYFFLRSKKKNQTNGAAGEKKFRVQCKNLAFYSTESHVESFFAEQKRKNGAAGKKKLRYSLDGAVSNPVPHGTLVVQPCFFFFFFFFFFF